MATIVKTQAELDSALASLAGKYGEIEIRSERGVWLTVTATDSATVRAYGSATVRATDSATVTATDSATVRAYGSATVRAYGSATVRATDSATVTATPHVAVHLHSSRVTVEGGVVIDVTDVNSGAEKWLAHHGIEVADGKVVVYKAVDNDLMSGRLFKYPIGETVTDKKWRDDHECGGGLHFCPLPIQALHYFDGATRFLACEVAVDDIRVIRDGGPAKCKVRAARVLHEVDIDGKALVTA